MGQTICEKILAKYSGNSKVVPGEYITLSDFVGPIGYSFAGFNYPQAMTASLAQMGLSIVKPERLIVNGDHNSPPQNIADVEQFNSVRAFCGENGITKLYDTEGIGHVVNIEKGDILPGILFVNIDPQAANAGGIGALYTNGGRLGSTMLQAFATDKLTVCVPGTIKVEINGKLRPGVTSRDIWFKLLNDIGPDGAHSMIIEYAGTTIDEMSIDQRLTLCGNAGFAGADGAIMQSDIKTQQWFKENFGRDVETIKSDSDATFAKVIHYNADDFVSMVTYPPEVFTSKPAIELNHVKVNQCTIGTCVGGTLDDLRLAAEIVKGKKIHHDVRFHISPVTQRVYVQASKEGLLATLAEAGARILSPSCDVCLGVQGPLASGEVGLSQQTLNVPGRSGSVEASIYLASAATIAASALTGYITDPADFI
ncbi:aconitase family protein [Fusibacter bizertensis]